MTRFTHLICFVFAAGLALATGALLMLGLSAQWPQGDPTAIVVVAVAIAILLPPGAAIASRWLLPGGQPVTGWLICFAMIVAIAVAASLLL